MYKFEDIWNRLPSLVRNAMDKCEQDPVYHPEGPAGVHTRLVYEYAQKNYPGDNDLLVSSIFHDLGKPETQRIKELPNGKLKISNYGHEFHTDRYIDMYFHLFADLTTDIEKVKEICKNHMKAHMYIDGRLKKPFKREAFENLKYFDDIIKFSACDSGGR